jgi:hypothetical protein
MYVLKEVRDVTNNRIVVVRQQHFKKANIQILHSSSGLIPPTVNSKSLTLFGFNIFQGGFMSLDNVNVQFHEFTPNLSFRTGVFELADKVQLKAPSDAFITMRIKKMNATTEAHCRIVSRSGIFPAGATHDNENECLRVLEQRIFERLNSWKRRRSFATRFTGLLPTSKQSGTPKQPSGPIDLNYDYHVRGIEDHYKKDADRTVRELRSQLGYDPSIHIGIERVTNKNNTYEVSLSVIGLSGRIHIRKSGKNVPLLLKKVKKTTLSRARQRRQKIMNRKPKNHTNSSTLSEHQGDL